MESPPDRRGEEGLRNSRRDFLDGEFSLIVLSPSIRDFLFKNGEKNTESTANFTGEALYTTCEVKSTISKCLFYAFFYINTIRKSNLKFNVRRTRGEATVELPVEILLLGLHERSC